MTPNRAAAASRSTLHQDRTMSLTPRRALISVSDKRNLKLFAELPQFAGLPPPLDRAWEFVSTGGTAKHLKSHGISCRQVSDMTGFPELMDGRLKTLHPVVHGGLLAIRGNVDHMRQAQVHGIEPFDLLVVNLYPFERTVASGAPFNECNEQIDIGGPAMLRAGAKNWPSVTVLVDPDDYPEAIRQITECGDTSSGYRKFLAEKTYAATSKYDAAIFAWFAKHRAIDEAAAKAGCWE